MSLKGAGFGALAGLLLGKSFWSAVFGAFFGHWMTNGGSRSRTASGASAQARLVFTRSAAALLAKMAKADGRVTADEIEAAEVAFRRLGFSEAMRREAVAAFRSAKDDDRSIGYYASQFTGVVRSVEVREVFYELLWDLASADSRVGEAELAILRAMPSALGISPQWFEIYRSERFRRTAGSSSRAGRSSSRQPPPPPRDELADAYSTLGVSASASDDEVKKAYREKAKRSHPDVLRSQGLPEEMIGKANERMARVNAAWSRIKEARGL